jgi:phospholipase C
MNGLLGPDGVTIDPRYKNDVAGRSNNPKTTFPAQAGATYTINPEEIDKKGFGGPAHSFPAATTQLYGSRTPSSFPDPAPLSGFAQSYFDELRQDVKIASPTDDQIAVPMNAFQHGQLPVLWQLAQEFCVCDRWFSEVPGPTQPNRLFVHAGTSCGFTHNIWQNPFNNPTIYEQLDKAGHDWSVFYFDLRDSDSFPQIKKRIDRVLQFDTFYAQAKAGTLPTYSFLCPRYNESKNPDEPAPNSEHAPYDVRNGENLIADVYEALRGGPLWQNTLLIITYDEHGGYYDHVSPPATSVDPPDDLVSPTDYDKQEAQDNPTKNGYLLQPDYRFDFKRLGLRVPTLLVSPWVPRGSVAKVAYQHTSIFATLRELFGVGVLTKRDGQAQSFAMELSLAAARTDAPARLNRPPATAGATAESLAAPLTQQQEEMWPLLSQLDGHKDSGKVTAPPATRAEAYDYVQERLAAHELFHRERRRKAAYRISQEPSGKYSWKLYDDQDEVIAASPKQYDAQPDA